MPSCTSLHWHLLQDLTGRPNAACCAGAAAVSRPGFGVQITSVVAYRAQFAAFTFVKPPDGDLHCCPAGMAASSSAGQIASDAAAVCSIADLPDELLIGCLSHLSLKTLCAAGCCCCDSAEQPSTIEHLSLRRQHHCSLPPLAAAALPPASPTQAAGGGAGLSALCSSSLQPRAAA